MRAALRQELAAIRELIAERDRLYEERRQSDAIAREAANTALSHRLENLNGNQGSLRDLSTQMIPRREHDGQLAGLSDHIENTRLSFEAKLETKYEPLNAKVEALGRPNYTLVVAIIGVCFGMITGGWYVMNLQIINAISPLQLSVEQNKVAVASDDVRLRQLEGTQQARTQAIADIPNIRQQVTTLVDRLQTIRSENTKQAAALIEIETQFCNADHVRNLNLAQENRLFAMLWQKVYGQEYPISNSFYPTICNRSGAADTWRN